jgi:hypothetical protein
MVAARKKRIGMVLESYENWMPIANAHLGYLARRPGNKSDFWRR